MGRVCAEDRARTAMREEDHRIQVLNIKLEETQSLSTPKSDQGPERGKDLRKATQFAP